MLMIGKPLTPEQRLAKNIAAIMAQDYFVALSGVLMAVEHSIDTKGETKTAVTNGKWAKYAPEFVETLSDAEFRAVILHETYHCLFKHLTTWQHLYDEDPQTANMACDYVINILINDAAKTIGGGFLKLPDCALLDEQFRDMDSAQVYEKLRKQGQGGGGGGQGQGQPGQPGNGQGQGQQPSMDDHDWKSASEMSEAERDELARTMDEALRQGALLAGKTGSGGMRELDQLTQTKVRWQDALREYLHEQCKGNEFSTWRRPNRRMVAQGIYMPSGVSEKLGEIVIGIDTSGSIGGPQLSQFLGEVKGICETLQPEAVRLLYWDTQVCADEKYERDQIDTLVSSTKPAGGGGTSPSCVTAYLREHNIRPQVVVMLTDGVVGNDWGGAWDCPVVWCVVGTKAVATVGETIHVEWD